MSLAEITDGQIEPRLDLAIGVLGQADRAGLGNAFQPRGDIDAVAHQIAVLLLDNITDVDADAELDTALGWQAGIALDHAALHLDGAADGVYNATKLDQTAIAGPFDHTSVMHRYGGINQVASECAKARQRAFLVRTGEAAVSDYICD